MTDTATAPLDAAKLRQDFPILATEVHGRPLVYLDNAASSQKPRQVLDAMTAYYCESNANVHRSPHYLGQVATDLYEGARARVARHVNAHATECVVWTRGTTEAINLVAAGWGRRNVSAGDTLLVTEMDHHSNLVPWHMLAKETGAQIDFVPVTDDGRLDLEVALAKLAQGPKLFAFNAKSNVLGTENPYQQLCAAARHHGVVTMLDAAQALPHAPLDFQAAGCDFMGFSSHKALGPMGIGNLIVHPDRFDELGPYQGGGEMIAHVSVDHSTYAAPPLRYEAGTPSVADTVGFHAALDYLEAVGPDRIHDHETRLTALALELMADLDVVTYGPADPAERAGIVSFAVPGAGAHDVATLLDGHGIAVRAGHHCAEPLMTRFGIDSTARASFYLYNTEDEVRAFVDALRQVQALLERRRARRAARNQDS